VPTPLLMMGLLPLNNLSEQLGLSGHYFRQTWWQWRWRRLLQPAATSSKPIWIAMCCPNHLNHGGLSSAKDS
jgi:hypothetical protein